MAKNILLTKMKEKIFLTLLLLALLMSTAIFADHQWSYQQLTTDGRMFDFAIDSSDSIHIAWLDSYDMVNNTLSYQKGKSNDNAWDTEEIIGNVGSAFETKILLTSDNKPYIFYSGDGWKRLYYTYKNENDEWLVPILYSPIYFGGAVNVVIDHNDVIHIVFVKTGTSDDNHYYSEFDTKTNQIILEPQTFGRGASVELAIDSDNKVHMMYFKYGQQDDIFGEYLYYRKQISGSDFSTNEKLLFWEGTLRDMDMDICIDDDDNPHLVISRSDTNRVMYFTKNNNEWHTDTLYTSDHNKAECQIEFKEGVLVSAWGEMISSSPFRTKLFISEKMWDGSWSVPEIVTSQDMENWTSFTRLNMHFNKTNKINFICAANTDGENGNNGRFYIYSEEPFVGIKKENKIDSGMIKCYPNPFNGEVTINIKGLVNRSKQEISIYNTLGQKIKKIEMKENKALWNGKDENGKEISSGIYMVKIRYGNKFFNKKMSYVK